MQQTVAGATAIMMATFVASRFLGWLRLSVIGANYGLSSELDAWWAAFLIPDFMFNLLVAGALASAFIPVFAGYLAKEDEREGWRVASTVLNATLVLLVVVSALMIVAAPFLVPLIVGVDSPVDVELTIELTRIMLLSPIFMGLSALVTGILNSYRQFLSGAMAPLVYNLTIILFAIFAGPFVGIHALAYGVVAGALLMWLVQIPELTFRRTQYRLALDLSHPAVREVAALAVPRVLSFAVVFVILVVDTVLASRLAEGSLSALRYAFQLMLLPLGVFSMAISSAVFPSLSHHFSLGQQQALRAGVLQAVRFILFLTLPAAVVMIVLRRPIVHLLFQYGDFGPAAREAVAAAFLFYALGLTGHALVQILNRAFYAARDTRTPLVTTAISVVVNVVLAVLLVRAVVDGELLGIRGLALANSIATLAEASLLLLLIRGRIGLPLTPLTLAAARQLAAALLMGILVFMFIRITNITVDLEASKIGLALQVVLALLVAGTSYVLACVLLRVEELRLLLHAIAVRRRRPSES